MGTTKKVTVQLQHRVPNWNYCNMYADKVLEQQVSHEKCRFCIEKVVEDIVEVATSRANKGRMGASSVRQKTIKRTVHVCALYNWPLDLQEGILVKKCAQCFADSHGAPVDKSTHSSEPSTHSSEPSTHSSEPSTHSSTTTRSLLDKILLRPTEAHVNIDCDIDENDELYRSQFLKQIEELGASIVDPKVSQSQEEVVLGSNVTILELLRFYSNKLWYYYQSLERPADTLAEVATISWLHERIQEERKHKR